VATHHLEVRATHVAYAKRVCVCVCVCVCV
jgi:hypothetical protein